MERSLKLSAQGKQEANTALKKFDSKANLAAQLGISRTTVTNFFAGRPVRCDRFHQICKKLKLEWQEIADLPQTEQRDKSIDIDSLVQEVRQKIKPSIQEQCGKMKVLDMSQPIGLKDIYTNVNEKRLSNPRQ
ncbi:MAG: helix-turn-helix domain-containing protein [Coleofasciculaceae cyanobacterium]